MYDKDLMPLGKYRDAEGTLYKVTVTKAPENRKYAMRLVPGKSKRYLNSRGNSYRTSPWEYEAGLLGRMASMTLEWHDEFVSRRWVPVEEAIEIVARRRGSA